MCLAYSINLSISVSGRDIPVVLDQMHAEDVKEYLESQINHNAVCVTDTVRMETHRKIQDIMAKKGSEYALSTASIRVLNKLAYERFDRLINTDVIADDLTRLSEVHGMYQNIWSDSGKDEKRRRWASIKKTGADKGPPAGPDLRILATAAGISSNGVIELFTFDHDFILFADEILMGLGVSIKNGYHKPY